ncbi:hypothetical protein SERLA73DRAFT_76799 [Serpula lacrymans var. lacrymans S7.3]|uniref:Rad21/Rec8-like protein N-terminal domain-containing protein n=2 Tax=Serpula lacrymans var. lacrymans TaxID=341189 RepID=F8Q836_SERL3|nr:uncharacterized protein SERLADRAFT_441616 [Serpula lacrymans var. lacrymans S7.9]EGN95724.1 hypothetical protein SERLA73DRAFT_76799 [Serpula lacrymans var. lacrymans S7.3]EGO21248.1 hypothetical protein SERLADRAFT_441616 [Serpula lacrymans var. lacrymans S7.9]
MAICVLTGVPFTIRLAATLGSKSTFKKLPRHSVMTADITQLCNLIAQPAEPLALRLSSNLLVGAARVYKAKEDIFMSDVTICFNSLKRVVQDLCSSNSAEAQLQMAQPTVRTSAVTLAHDPKDFFAMDLDNMVVNWDVYLDVGWFINKDGTGANVNTKNGESAAGKSATGAGRRRAANTEVIRADTHTLVENHDYLLSSSADISCGQVALDISSSQFGGGFDFGDSFFGPNGGLDLDGEIDDELARQLGTGCNLVPGNNTNMGISYMDPPDLGFLLDDMGPPFTQELSLHAPFQNDPDDHMAILPCDLQSSIQPVMERSQLSPFRYCTPKHDSLHNAQPDDIPFVVHTVPKQAPNIKRRFCAHMDTRIELTDDELKAARLQYVEQQMLQRRALVQRKFSREHRRLIDDMLCGVPGNLHTKTLVEFWKNNFMAQTEARSPFCIGDPRLERQKSRIQSMTPINSPNRFTKQGVSHVPGDWEADVQMYEEDVNGMGAVESAMNARGMDFRLEDCSLIVELSKFQEATWPPQNIRSSEEPGQARRISHALPGDVNQQFSLSSASNELPWNNAAYSSSISGAVHKHGRQSNDKVNIEHQDVHIRLGSLGRERESSILSRTENAAYMDICSAVPRSSQLSTDEDFVFDVPGEHPLSELKLPDMNNITLEKDSVNFLLYAKTLPLSVSGSPPAILFDVAVPKATSTVRVAAAALYHCLVLNTKGLIRLRQDRAYGRIMFTIKCLFLGEWS